MTGIAANIVTFNRRDLLLRCLDAVLGQTLPVDVVYVVDNGSTDGTVEALLQRGFLVEIPEAPAGQPALAVTQFPLPRHPGRRAEIHYLRMPRNGGSAAGQREGMRRAFEAGHDWIWIMDDDGYPAEDCLALLLDACNDDSVRAPLVVDVDDPRCLAFSLMDPVTGNVIKRLGDVVRDVYRDEVNPFNGLLVPRSTIEAIGYPDARMFIWGDEVDYLERIRRYGIAVATYSAARFRHPASKVRYQYGWFGKPAIFHAQPINMYCYYRNYTYIKRKYEGRASMLRFIGLDLLKRLILADVAGLRIMTLAVVDALRGRWGGEEAFLSSSSREASRS